MGMFSKKVQVGAINDINKNLYENRNKPRTKQDNLDNKLNVIDKIISKGYNYSRFNYISKCIGSLSVSTIQNINKYLMKLHGECNYYYYNSETLIEFIFENIENIKLSHNVAKYYSEELRAVIRALDDISEGNLKLNKNQFISISCLGLYFTRPTHLGIEIPEIYYSEQAMVYVLESILDLIDDIINNYITVDEFVFKSEINKLNGDYEDDEERYNEEENDSYNSFDGRESISFSNEADNQEISENSKEEEVSNSSSEKITSNWGFDDAIINKDNSDSQYSQYGGQRNTKSKIEMDRNLENILEGQQKPQIKKRKKIKLGNMSEKDSDYQNINDENTEEHNENQVGNLWEGEITESKSYEYDKNIRDSLMKADASKIFE